MKKVLCALLTALTLFLPFSAAWGEGWEINIYTDESGKKVRELYNEQGVLVSKSYLGKTPDGEQRNYNWNAGEALAGGRYVDGKYMNASRAKERYNPDGSIELFYYYDRVEGSKEYDANGVLRRYKCWELDGKYLSETYDENGVLCERRSANADGIEEKEVYFNGVLWVKSWIEADGKRIEETYDENGVLMQKRYTDMDGTKVEEYYVNGILAARSSTDAEGRTVSETYDANGALTEKTTTDADGKQENQQYNENGVTNGNTITYSGPDGSHISEQYDENGNLTNKHYSNADGKDVHERYDKSGALVEYTVSYVNADGKDVYEYYDGSGALEGYEVFYVNAEGKEITEWYNADKELESVYSTDYDSDGNQITEFYDAKGSLTTIATSYQENGFDYEKRENYENGALVSSEIHHKDGERYITETYSTDGVLMKSYVSYVDADGKDVNERYDGSGALVEYDVSYVNAEGKRITEWYNADKELEYSYYEDYDSDGNQVIELYDAKGSLQTITTYYQENGFDYQKSKNYENGTLVNIEIYHEEGENCITEKYSADGVLMRYYISYVNAEGKEITERYNAEKEFEYSYFVDYDSHGNQVAEYHDAKGSLMAIATYYQENGFDYERWENYENGALVNIEIYHEEGENCITETYSTDGVLLKTDVTSGD